jgi:uncharacterized protein YfiM (DUF2279 family)
MRSPPRWVPALATLVWAAWILYLGMDDRRRVVGFSGTPSEAIQHLVAFAVLGALAMATARGRPWAVFGLAAAAGVLGEFIQLASSVRTFSVADMAFSVAGAAIGVAVVCRSRRDPTLALVSVAALLVAIAPLVLERSMDTIDTSFSEDCSAHQEGPTRLFTISDGTGVDDVDFHLGLEDDDLSVRLRTSCDIFNWIVVPDVSRRAADIGSL